MTTNPAHCGNDPRAELTDGDRKAVADFKARLALQASAKPYIDEAVWVDGDPLMEVIAVTLWERCTRDDAEQPQAVCDDPRTIAAFAAAVARAHAAAVPPADRAAWVPCSPEWLAANPGQCSIAPRVPGPEGVSHLHPAATDDQAAIEGHRLVLSEALGLGTGAPWDAIHDRATELGLPPLDQDPVARRLGLLPAPVDRAAEPEAETPLEKRLRFSERRNDELRTECKRRGKRVLEQSERLQALEREIDEVRRQLGAEILRAGQAEAELRRLAAEATPQNTEARDSDEPEWARPETEEEKLAKARRMAKALSAPPVAPAEWATTTEWPLRHKRYRDRRVHATAPFVVNDVQRIWTACEKRVGDGGYLVSHLPVDCRDCKRAVAGGEPEPAVVVAPQPDALRLSEEVCPGFPDRCPNLRTVDPEPGVHLGGVRCGCADETPRRDPHPTQADVDHAMRVLAAFQGQDDEETLS